MAQTPTQSQLLKLYAAEKAAGQRRKQKKGYHNVIALGIGAAAVASAVVGMPDAVSWGLTALSAGSWFVLKRL